MESFQANNERNKVQNDHEERVNQIDSGIKKQKEKLLKEFEESSDDSRKRRPKHSQSEANRSKTAQTEALSSEQRPPFAPFVADTLQLQGDEGIYFDAVSYNDKYNMIIACPQDCSVQFYNATTLLPLEGFQTKKLDFVPIRMVYCLQSETYLLGCFDGNIYAYNLSSKTLHKIQKQGSIDIITLTFINSKYYAFAATGAHQFSIGNLENGDLLHFNLEDQKKGCYLYSLEKGSFLLSSRAGGPLHVYRTDRLPGRLPILYSARGYDLSESVSFAKIQSLTFKGKEYMVTIGSDGIVKIWHFSKGKMKPLKTFNTGERIGCVVYLENYQILAISHLRQIKFFSFPSGILEYTLDLNMHGCYGIFLMKDKNCLGVPSFNENKIKIVKFSPS